MFREQKHSGFGLSHRFVNATNANKVWYYLMQSLLVRSTLSSSASVFMTDVLVPSRRLVRNLTLPESVFVKSKPKLCANCVTPAVQDTSRALWSNFGLVQQKPVSKIVHIGATNKQSATKCKCIFVHSPIHL